MKKYFALVEGFILGAYRKVGEPVGELSDLEAKYPLLSGQIGTSAPKASGDKKEK